MARQSSSPFPVREWSLPDGALWLTGAVGSNCTECGAEIEDFHFVQVKLKRFTPPGPRLFKHECCDDPHGYVAHGVAHLDAQIENARGHKSQVNAYYFPRERRGRK